MTENMRAVLLEVKAGKSPFDNLKLSPPQVARAVEQSTEAGLIVQPYGGPRVLTEAGQKALSS
jgi:hypothetical protein